MTLTDRLPPGPDPDVLVEVFAEWAFEEQGISLYPAQEEALLEIVTGANVILSTPTGSGKSLVAVGAHAASLARGERTFYTAPIKALVSEKFFALIDVFGADKVGMLTGDAAVNETAPIICCTAEILANIALRSGARADVGTVVMDEFHFYADPDRGWAWQVPLIELPQAQFVLMSATLGDVTFFRDDLTRRTGRPTALVTSVERPVPLHYRYVLSPLHETITELLSTHEAPVYVVHFTQASAVERAQALMSVNVTGREEKQAIADLIGNFRFTAGFGKTLSRLVRHGIGVHHAGMLPRYRRLVETLAQAGLLKVICGTDTLGVGINVPIRTVLFTALTKYDGVRTRGLKAREFHQIAGRAGRAGYDVVGTVVAQAPEHEVENARLLARAGDDVKKRRRIVRKKAPEGFVNWSDKTFERLQNAQPEALTSHFVVTHAMVLNVISRPGDAFAAMRHLLEDNHEPRERQRRHIVRAISIYRGLREAGVVEELPEPDPEGRRVRIVGDLQLDFALNQPLSPFALAALELLDRESPDYPMDVLSVVEATLDDPRPVLYAQQSKAKGEAVAAMKAEGIEYEQRMVLLEDVTLAQAARRAAHRRAGELPARASVGRRRAAVAQVGGARHERAGDDVRRVRRALPAGPVGGPGAALPRRHLPGAAPDRAGRGEDRGADRRRRVAGRAGAPGRLEPARRVGEARRRGGRRRGRPAAARPADPRASPATSAPSACSCATRCSAAWSWPRCAGGTSGRAGPPGGLGRGALARGARAVLRRARPTSAPVRTPAGRGSSPSSRSRSAGSSARSSTTPRATATGRSARRSTSRRRTRRAPRSSG